MFFADLTNIQAGVAEYCKCIVIVSEKYCTNVAKYLLQFAKKMLIKLSYLIVPHINLGTNKYSWHKAITIFNWNSARSEKQTRVTSLKVQVIAKRYNYISILTTIYQNTAISYLQGLPDKKGTDQQS